MSTDRIGQIVAAPKPRGWEAEGTYSGRAEYPIPITEIRQEDGATVVVVDSGRFARDNDLFGFPSLPLGFGAGLI